MNVSNLINVNGQKLKTVHYNKSLFRADKRTFKEGKSASLNYRNAPMKYFTLNKNELGAYTKYGMPYIKTWKPSESLILIDILHRPTREALSKLIGANSLNIAFPIKENKVSRISEENTRQHDDIVLSNICKLANIDGYLMEKLEKNGKYVFHSEVGLCPRGFEKLVLEHVEKNSVVVPRLSDRKTRRREFKNNENNENNIRELSKTRKSPRMLGKLSFNNMNTNMNISTNNNKPSTFGRRLFMNNE